MLRKWMLDHVDQPRKAGLQFHHALLRDSHRL